MGLFGFGRKEDKPFKVMHYEGIDSIGMNIPCSFLIKDDIMNINFASGTVSNAYGRQAGKMRSSFVPYGSPKKESVSFRICSLFIIRKKARSAHLFVCKRTHNDSLSQPPFYERAFGTKTESKLFASSKKSTDFDTKSVLFIIYSFYPIQGNIRLHRTAGNG